MFYLLLKCFTPYNRLYNKGVFSMKRRIEEVKKIVIKVGSSSLCDKDGKINKEKILMLTWQIAKQ